MTCNLTAPQTADAWLSLIDDCATAYGGEAWATLALMGVLVLVALGLAVVALAAVAGVGRP